MAKVSEKTLELNISSEILQWIRSRPGCAKAFLRGLTQAEERNDGVDVYAQLSPHTRVYAFQFKAPNAGDESEPYRFTIRRYQHEPLRAAARANRGSVFYVFPFYLTIAKLAQRSPTLSTDTWLLDAATVSNAVFGNYFRTRTVRCEGGTAHINPKLSMTKLSDVREARDSSEDVLGKGLSLGALQRLLRKLHEPLGDRGLSPWAARTLRGVFVPPADQDTHMVADAL